MAICGRTSSSSTPRRSRSGPISSAPGASSTTCCRAPGRGSTPCGGCTPAGAACRNLPKSSASAGRPVPAPSSFMMATMGTGNVYFDLTEELNAEGDIAVLASGQAVVFYKISMMSKDGDWILRETPEACEKTLAILGHHGARYRPGAPLDVRWLAGGWSSH